MIPIEVIFNMQYENSVFKVDTNRDQISDSILECINGRAIEAAAAFGVYNLPSEFKICIHFCEYKQFIDLADKAGILKQYKECLAFCSDAVYAIEYTLIKARQPENDYCKIILHECIHILQHISTGLAPIKAIWLYESIACYLSDQKLDFPTHIPSWYIFQSDFYLLKDNYAIAYALGKELIDNVGLEKIIEIQQNLKELQTIGYSAYNALQTKYALSPYHAI